MFLQIYSKTIKKLCLFYYELFKMVLSVVFLQSKSLGSDYIIYTVDYSLPYISVACKIILL